jgi:hypothetical protein
MGFSRNSRTPCLFNMSFAIAIFEDGPAWPRQNNVMRYSQFLVNVP